MQVLAQVLTKLPSWLVPLGSALLHYSLEANQSIFLNINIFLNLYKRDNNISFPCPLWGDVMPKKGHKSTLQTLKLHKCKQFLGRSSRSQPRGPWNLLSLCSPSPVFLQRTKNKAETLRACVTVVLSDRILKLLFILTANKTSRWWC